ncbi:hypothetical protein ACNTMW_33430 [Planosporangium sp. 12N6]|uniref:hypothetical protein n=1 Tax=Planosporangium spinosum TaxID=3402278 RepID=UPI003CEA6A20
MTTSTEALFGPHDAWYHVVVRGRPGVPLIAWLLDEGLTLPGREGVLLPVWCTEAAATMRSTYS